MKVNFQNQEVSILAKHSQETGISAVPTLRFYTELKVNNSVFVGVTSAEYKDEGGGKYNLKFSVDGVQFIENYIGEKCDDKDFRLINDLIYFLNSQTSFNISKQEYDQFILNNQSVVDDNMIKKYSIWENISIRVGQKIYSSDFDIAWKQISAIIKNRLDK